MINHQQLAQMAIEAKAMAYVPYSNFQVGAALLTKSGKIYTGCNIESASYSPTNCAERTAIFKAVSEGEQDFLAIAVAGSTKGDYCYPCGVCRQMMKEFIKKGEEDKFIIIVAKTATDYVEHTLADLLPYGFGREDLGK